MEKERKGIPCFGEKISRARLLKPASQNEVAVAVGVQRETVSGWEKPGINGVRAGYFRKLIDFLGVKAEDIRADVDKSGSGDDQALTIIRFVRDAGFSPKSIARAGQLLKASNQASVIGEHAKRRRK